MAHGMADSLRGQSRRQGRRRLRANGRGSKEWRLRTLLVVFSCHRFSCKLFAGRSEGKQKAFRLSCRLAEETKGTPPLRYHVSWVPRKFGDTFHGSTQPLCSQFGRFPCFVPRTIRRFSEGRFPLAVFYHRVLAR